AQQDVQELQRPSSPSSSPRPADAPLRLPSREGRARWPERGRPTPAGVGRPRARVHSPVRARDRLPLFGGRRTALGRPCLGQTLSRPALPRTGSSSDRPCLVDRGGFAATPPPASERAAELRADLR